MSIGRFAVMWTLMAIAMSANGILRELVLLPSLGRPWAAAGSALLGVALLGVISWWGFRPLAAQLPPRREVWRWSVALLVLTVGFETVLGRVVDHKSWSEIGRHYALWEGEWWPLVLAWLVATPFVWARPRVPPARGAR